MSETAVKSVSADGARIGGYLVVWGTPARKDLTGEYFTPQTDLGLELYPVRPALYHHGLDKAVGATLIGVIDTLRPDEVGLWAEAQLDLRNRYVRAVQSLVARGALSWSSGSLPHLVRKAADGRIERWPLVEGSLTATPAETRHTSVSAIKSAYHALGLDTALLEPLGAKQENRFQMTDAVTVQDNLTQTVGALAEAVKALTQDVAGAPRPPQIQSPALKRLPFYADPAPAPRVEVLRATKYGDLSPSDMAFMHEILSSDRRGWNPGEAFYRELADKTFRAVNSRELGYDAVRGLVERGIKSANDMNSAGQASFGQEWVADSWRTELWQKVRQENVVAPLFPFVEMPTNPYELPFESTDPTVYFVAETNDSANTNPSSSPVTLSKAGTGKVQMNAKKLALRVAWSSELNEDSLIPIIANYRRQAIRAMQNAIDNVLVNGDTATGASVNVNLIDGTPTASTLKVTLSLTSSAPPSQGRPLSLDLQSNVCGQRFCATFG